VDSAIITKAWSYISASSLFFVTQHTVREKGLTLSEEKKSDKRKMRFVLLLLLTITESTQFRRRSWGKKSVCSAKNCNTCDAFLMRYAGTKKTSLGSREFQFCSSMRRNRQCCGMGGNGIVDLIGVSSECCSEPSGCIQTVGESQPDNGSIDEGDIRGIMGDMEQCKSLVAG